MYQLKIFYVAKLAVRAVVVVPCCQYSLVESCCAQKDLPSLVVRSLPRINPKLRRTAQKNSSDGSILLSNVF